MGEWHANLYDATRRSALLLFRGQMKRSSFPDEKGCTSIKEALAAENDGEQWRRVVECLVELQIVQDAFLVSRQSPRQQPMLPPDWRFDLMDEFCRPIADRLRYHFLEETAILNERDNDTGAAGAASMERLPEWLFRYLRELVDKALDVLLELQTFIYNVSQSVIGRLEGNESIGEEEETHSSLQQAIQALQPYHQNSMTYFLREIVRMARHALRSKSYFSHPDVVGRDAKSGLAARGIEQLFLFDDFIRNTMNDAGQNNDGGGLEVPRLVDIFLAENDELFQWWLEEERYGAIVTLRECANATLSSYQKPTDSDANTDALNDKTSQLSNQMVQPQLFPPLSELLISLIHSSRIKSNSFTNLPSRQHYIANVVGFLSSEYLDMIHSEATLLRKQLLSRSKKNSIPSDSDLTINAMEWIGIINGVHIASVMLHSCNRDNHEVWERAAVSLERMRDAMVEDFTSAFIETVVMERAKFASYVMRCPFLLSQSTLDNRRGQREGSLPSNLHLSLDLTDSFHLISVVLQACQKSLTTVEDMMSSQSNSNESSSGLATTQMLSYGAYAIKNALSTSISQKLLDIAIDPQGMTPEIHLSGAQQFRCDAMSIVHLFSSRTDQNGTGPLERVAAASHLMSLTSTQLQQLKQILFDLSASHNKIGSMFAGGIEDEGIGVRLEVESFYSDERLVMEAESMLSAKGFHALALEEALSIINRRIM